jgi:diguanylate cyclase
VRESPNRARLAAEAAWQALHKHNILASPRNFELWFAYYSDDKPSLRHRIDKLIATAEPWSPTLLEALYSEFCRESAETTMTRDNAHELRQIAAQMAARVMADRSAISTYGLALNACKPIFETDPSIADMQRAIEMLRVATADTGNRMRALEQLFSASLLRIGELHEQLARVEKEALSDPLTGLANRRAFDLALAQALSTADLDGSNVALLMLDIDHFKAFNDTHGHAMGDNVLRLVAQVLTNHIKGRDLAARYGGEEYTIILLGADVAAATTVADQIRTLLERRPLLNLNTGANLGVITCSIGVAVHRAGDPAANLIERADRALYAAKRSGRNKVASEAML